MSRPTWLCGAIVAAFVVLGLLYNYSMPLFEGSDEASHYRVASYYASHLSLPDLERPPAHEAQQPPLYYAICGLFIRGIDRDDFYDTFMANPDFGRDRYFNLAPTDLSLTPAGTTLAVRICRLISTLLGAATVALVFVTARFILKRDDVALLAAALTAFNPKFIHLSSVVSNDVAVCAAGMLVLALAARIATRGAGPTLISSFGLGLAIGIAALSKYSGLAMLAPAGLALGWAALRTRRPVAAPASHPWRRLALCAVAMMAGAILVAGWLFAYQFARYGDPLAWQQVDTLNSFARRATPLDGPQLLAMIPRLAMTYWGGFAIAIEVPAWVDWVMTAVLCVAVAGLGVALARRALPVEMVLPVVTLLACWIALIPWARSYGATENSRLLGPVFGAVPILLAAGLSAWIPGRWRARAYAGLGLAGCLGAVAAPFLFFAPVYDRPAAVVLPSLPRPLADSEVAALPIQSPAPFENGIEMVYASIRNNRIDSNGVVDLTLYWRVYKPILARSYSLIFEAFDEQGKSLARLSRPPLSGTLSTTAWGIGDVFRDEQIFTLPIEAITQPVVAYLYVGWHEIDPPYNVVRVQGNDAVSIQVAQIKIRARQAQTQAPSRPVDARFGDGVALEGYDLQGDTLTLYWRSLGEPAQNYTVFVHSLDASGTIIAQQDAPFAYAAYLWDEGEQIVERRDVPGLADAVSIRVGVYDATTQQRLIPKRANGEVWADDAVRLGR